MYYNNYVKKTKQVHDQMQLVVNHGVKSKASSSM